MMSRLIMSGVRRGSWGFVLAAVSVVLGCAPEPPAGGSATPATTTTESAGPSVGGPDAASSTTTAAPAGSGNQSTGPVELLHVSYDPTRELWKEFNDVFVQDFKQKTGRTVTVKQSHGGSGSQARAVIDGLEADVISLAMWSDVDAISKKGLIAADWESRLPNRALPFTSTIVMVVRKGNPKGIKDWSDLVKPGVEVITPSPKTSGNGRLSFLAAWGHIVNNGGSEDQAKDFVTKLYAAVPVLDAGARGSTTTFSQRGIGDVHLAWESEAHLEVTEAAGELEIVYPPTSILAEPPVAVVDQVVDRKGTREVAEAYLQFVYTPAGQAIVAKHFNRPSDAEVLAANKANFPDVKVFSITDVAKDWDDAQSKYFAEGALFDQIYEKK